MLLGVKSHTYPKGGGMQSANEYLLHIHSPCIDTPMSDCDLLTQLVC